MDYPQWNLVFCLQSVFPFYSLCDLYLCHRRTHKPLLACQNRARVYFVQNRYHPDCRNGQLTLSPPPGSWLSLPRSLPPCRPAAQLTPCLWISTARSLKPPSRSHTGICSALGLALARLNSSDGTSKRYACDGKDAACVCFMAGFNHSCVHSSQSVHLTWDSLVWTWSVGRCVYFSLPPNSIYCRVLSCAFIQAHSNCCRELVITYQCCERPIEWPVAGLSNLSLLVSLKETCHSDKASFTIFLKPTWKPASTAITLYGYTIIRAAITARRNTTLSYLVVFWNSRCQLTA